MALFEKKRRNRRDRWGVQAPQDIHPRFDRIKWQYEERALRYR